MSTSAADEQLPEDVLNFLEGKTAAEIRRQMASVTSEMSALRSEIRRLKAESNKLTHDILQNKKQVMINSGMPHLVASISEIIDREPDEDTADEAAAHQTAKEKSAVVKTTTRMTVYLPDIGLVDPSELRPGDLVGVNKDSYLVLTKLPVEYDSRVVSMELCDPPDERYEDIGGLDDQVAELQEAVVWPIEKADLFKQVGIRPPKGVLLHGPPGTGKTLLARACAAQTKSTFLRLAGPQLVQAYGGEGSMLVREMFALAREKAPSIIFIDEIDAIGTKRFDSDQEADRLVQRTMLELLSQMDGFDQDESVRVIAATNRPDILDPALLRAGRFDRKIEFPLPNERGRAQILRIHSKRMNLASDVDFNVLAAATPEFNGAQLKAVAVEAGMLALRAGQREVRHADFQDGIQEVLHKKVTDVEFYS